MGIGFGLLCEKCGYEKDVMLGSGFSHGDPEGIIESCTKYDQISIKEIFTDDMEIEQEGYSLYQCRKCYSLSNTYHLKLIKDGKEIYKTKRTCNICKIKKKRIAANESTWDVYKVPEKYELRCPKCEENPLLIVINQLMWD